MPKRKRSPRPLNHTYPEQQLAGCVPMLRRKSRAQSNDLGLPLPRYKRDTSPFLLGPFTRNVAWRMQPFGATLKLFCCISSTAPF
jgi:hypothetical protein